MTAAASRARGAVRFFFAYAGGKVQLSVRETVDMVAPPSETILLGKGHSGFWYELRDRAGKVLYQRVVQNPIQYEIEVFEDEVHGKMRREPVTDPSGSFVLVVPDLPDAQTLVLMSSPLDPERAAEAASELASFSIAPPQRKKRSRDGRQ